MVFNPRRNPADDGFVLEPLEARTLLSVTLDPAGLLTINGTDAADAIKLRPGQHPGTIIVKSSIKADTGTYTNVTALQILAGDGHDKIKLKGRFTTSDSAATPLPITITGEEGDDRIKASKGPDTIFGGPGNDRINARAGDDTISGGPGNDRLSGKRGNDTLTYADVPAGVTIDLAKATAPNDGYGDKDPRIKGFESLTGTSFTDRFTKHKKRNTTIQGNGGDDIFINPSPSRDDPSETTDENRVLNIAGFTTRTNTLIRGTATDGLGAIRLLTLYDNDNPDNAIDLTASLEEYDGSFAVDQSQLDALLSIPLEYGDTYNLRLLAEDFAGNTTELLMPVIKGMKYGPITAGATPDTPTTADPPTSTHPLPDKIYQLAATATDIAGNTSDQSDYVVTQIDTHRPLLSVTIDEMPGHLHFGFAPSPPGFDPGSIIGGPTGGIITGGGTTGGGGSGGSSGGSGSTVVITGGILSNILIVNLSPDSDTGRSQTDRVTNDNTPTLTIEHQRPRHTIDDSSIIDISLNGVVVASIPWEPNVEWTLSPLADGRHTVSASVRLASTGHVAASSIERIITIDTIPPAEPSIHIAPESDTGRSDTDAITNIAAPMFILEGSSDSRITVSTKRIALVEESTAPGTTFDPPDFDPDAQPSFFHLSRTYRGTTTSDTLDDGIYQSYAVASDLAGNTTPAPAPYQFTIDTTPPWPPILDLLPTSDTGHSDSDNITADNTPTFSLTAQIDSTIDIFAGGRLISQLTPTTTETTQFTLGT